MQAVTEARWHWAAVGERAILLTWQGLNEHRGTAVRQLTERARELSQPSFEEIVPGIGSVMFLYDPLQWAAQLVRAQIASILPHTVHHCATVPTIIDIPVSYGGDDGPDLLFVADACGLSPANVIALHTGVAFPVLMLGFMPGFPYLGQLPTPLHLPRRRTPRSHVPAGSVAIANDQTGIYPNQSPGGWHILGRTKAQLFDPLHDPPALLKAGDLVRFISTEVRHG